VGRSLYNVFMYRDGGMGASTRAGCISRKIIATNVFTTDEKLREVFLHSIVRR
jgi:hypothetical protein